MDITREVIFTIQAKLSYFQTVNIIRSGTQSYTISEWIGSSYHNSRLYLSLQVSANTAAFIRSSARLTSTTQWTDSRTYMISPNLLFDFIRRHYELLRSHLTTIGAYYSRSDGIITWFDRFKLCRYYDLRGSEHDHIQFLYDLTGS